MGKLNPVSLANAIYAEAEDDERQRKQLVAETHVVGTSCTIFGIQMVYLHSEPVISAEQVDLLNSLQKCLDLRNKYMMMSLQRLGDDPRDYDGHFQPFSDEYADVSSVCPDTPLPVISIVKPNEPPFEPWKISPAPPPPHWHWKDKPVVNPDGSTKAGDKFEFEKCVIPGPHEGWSFALDEKGVYQVYRGDKGRYCVARCGD